jgi:hypothetical protein
VVASRAGNLGFDSPVLIWPVSLGESRSGQIVHACTIAVSFGTRPVLKDENKWGPEGGGGHSRSVDDGDCWWRRESGNQFGIEISQRVERTLSFL